MEKKMENRRFHWKFLDAITIFRKIDLRSSPEIVPRTAEICGSQQRAQTRGGRAGIGSASFGLGSVEGRLLAVEGDGRVARYVGEVREARGVEEGEQ